MNAVPPRPMRDRLALHPFFTGLDSSLIAAAGANVVESEYDTGALLVEEGSAADAFLLIEAGKVALEVVAPGRPRLTIQTLGPGEVLGWSWLMEPYRWRLDARALKPTRALRIAAAPLRRALEENPSGGYQFLCRLLPIIGQRLENTRIQLLDVHAV
jgi:CRP/FNR family transcriptional regulator, cyclic AMP receptor protein